MEEQFCPSIQSCQLVISNGFIDDNDKRRNYIDAFCKSGKNRWEGCTRYLTKNALNFCPDFVLPDSDLTPGEVIDRFDALAEHSEDPI